MIEREVRAMLERRADDATASSDAWERIAERIADDPGPAPLHLDPRRSRFNGGAFIGAIAAALLLVVGSVAVLRNDDGNERVRAANDPSTSPSGDREPGTGRPAVTTASGQRPIWPATTDEGLARLQAEADAGRRPDLLDPKASAASYLSERFIDDSTGRLVQNFAVGDFAQGDPTSGEVPYQSPPDNAGGTVLVRHRGGDGGIWFVVGAISPGLDVHAAAYDGSDVTGEVAVARPGTLDITISSTDSADPVSSKSRLATPGQPIALRERVADRPAVVVDLRFVEARSGTLYLAEFRVDRIPAAAPPPEATFEASAEAAARQWIRALAVGDDDAAWNLVAEASRSAIGGRSGFDARLAELAEGWGAWDGAASASYRTVSLMGDGDDGEVPAALPRLGVVVVSGRVSQEGTATHRTMSLPVRGTSGKAQVDPLVEVNIELHPADGSRMSPGRTLTAYTVAGAKIWFVIDDRAPVGPDNSEGADGDQQKATLTPAPALSSGQHSFTAVVLTVDGRVASRSATYTVG